MIYGIKEMIHTSHLSDIKKIFYSLIKTYILCIYNYIVLHTCTVPIINMFYDTNAEGIDD